MEANMKPAQINFHSKRQHIIANMNDIINMDSTIARSVNARSLLITW